MMLATARMSAITFADTATTMDMDTDLDKGMDMGMGMGMEMGMEMGTVMGTVMAMAMDMDMDMDLIIDMERGLDTTVMRRAKASKLTSSQVITILRDHFTPTQATMDSVPASTFQAMTS